MDTFKVWSIDELMAECERLESLPVTHPESLYGFARDNERGGWDIHWGGYLYWIEDACLRDDADLFRWIDQVGTKAWKGMTAAKLTRFIRAVRKHLARVQTVTDPGASA